MILNPIPGPTNTRRQRKSNGFAYGKLEPRQLLAAVSIASYSEDFAFSQVGQSQSQSAPWQYLWNAPNGNDINSNPLFSGGTSDQQDFTTLVPGANSGWKVDVSNPNYSKPGEFLWIGHNGALAGAGTANAGYGGEERFAIISYQVPQDGIYSIANSHVDLSQQPKSDGVNFYVFKNRNTKILEGIVDTDSIGNFDADLGFLEQGEKVFVAFGPGENNQTNYHDFFNLDYSIELEPENGIEVARYSDPSVVKYQSTETGWLSANYTVETGGFYTLSDTHVSPAEGVSGIDFGINVYRGSVPGSGTALDRGNVAMFDRAYFDTDIGFVEAGEIIQINYRNSDAKDLSTSPSEIDTDFLIKYHPEREIEVVDYSSVLLTELTNRHIASYAVENSGQYRIKNSFVAPTGSDGIELTIRVNEEPALAPTPVTIASGQIQNFDIDLGYLEKGDNVSIQFQAQNAVSIDSYDTDFSVVRLVPRAAPDFTLDNIDFSPEMIVNVDAATGSNDIQKIIAAIDEAKLKQVQFGYAKIEFPPNQTYLISDGNTNASFRSKFILDVSTNAASLDNTLISGNNATFLLNDFRRGFMRIASGKNVIFRDFTVDYASVNGAAYQPVTFTQGTISNINSVNNTFDLVIDQNYLGANGESGLDNTWIDKTVVFGGQVNQGNGNFVDTFREVFAAGWAVDPSVPGRLNAGEPWHRTTKTLAEISAGVFRISVSGGGAQSLDGLAVGDRYLLTRRINNAVFQANSSKHLTFENVTVHSSPSTVFSGSNSSLMSFTSVNVDIRPNSTRLMSSGADAIHLKSERVGAWIEDSTFNGVADDVINFTHSPGTIVRVVDANRTKIDLKLVNRGSVSNSAANSYLPNDLLVFVNPIPGPDSDLVPFKARVLASVANSDGARRVTLDRPLPVMDIDVGTGGNTQQRTLVVNQGLSRGYVAQDNHIGNSRRHGALMLASNAHLIDNVFEGNHEQAIAGHSDLAWPILNFTTDVLVQGNTFIDNGRSSRHQSESYFTGTVSFYADQLDGTFAHNHELVDEPLYAYSDIQIRDNVFYEWNRTAITIRNAERVTIAENTILAGKPNPVRNQAYEVQYTKDVSFVNNAIGDHGYAIEQSNNLNLREVGTAQIPHESHLNTWLKFDETSGSVVDSSVNSRTVHSFAGPINDIDGRLKSGLRTEVDFQGVGFSDGLYSGYLTERTVSLWFNADEVDSNEKQVIYMEGRLGLGGMNIYIDDGKLYVSSFVAGGNEAFLSVPIQSDEWNHVAFVLSDSNQKFQGFLNGRKFSEAVGVKIPRDRAFVTLARSSGLNTLFADGTQTSTSNPHSFVGEIDNFRIYDSALYPPQIAGLALNPIQGANSLSGAPSNVSSFDSSQGSHVGVNGNVVSSGFVGLGASPISPPLQLTGLESVVLVGSVDNGVADTSTSRSKHESAKDTAFAQESLEEFLDLNSMDATAGWGF